MESWLVFVTRGWLAVLLGRTQENWVFMHRILLHVVLERAQFIFAIWKEVTVFCRVKKLVHHYGNILPWFENLYFFCVAIFDLAVYFFNWNEIANFAATTSAWRLRQMFLLTNTRRLDHICLIILDGKVKFVRLAFYRRAQLYISANCMVKEHWLDDRLYVLYNNGGNLIVAGLLILIFKYLVKSAIHDSRAWIATQISDKNFIHQILCFVDLVLVFLESVDKKTQCVLNFVAGFQKLCWIEHT